MQRLAIIGLGLMGGALGLGVRRRGMACEVRGYARREATRKLALERGAADGVFDRPEEAVRDADLTVLCLPVLAMEECAVRCRAHFKAGSVVTDVGSTKGALVRDLESALEGAPVSFVGSHPIAGSDAFGLEAAREDLYEGALVVVTPGSRTPPEPLVRVRSFWEQLGARTVCLSPEEHDRMLGRTSHVVHLAAAAVAANALRNNPREVLPFCGSGFRDTTRVAAGSEGVWHDIVKSNAAVLAQELNAVGGLLKRLETLVREGRHEEIRAFLGETRRLREELDRETAV